MTKPSFNELLSVAWESIQRITDDCQKVDAISKIIHAVSDYEQFEHLNSIVCENQVKEPIVVNVKATTEEQKVEAENKKEVKQEPLVVVKLEQQQEEAKTVEEAVEETIKEEAEEEIPMPKENETDEEEELRHTLFIKKYGDMTINELSQFPDVAKYIVSEINMVRSRFAEVIRKHYNDEESMKMAIQEIFNRYENYPGTFKDVRIDMLLNEIYPDIKAIVLLGEKYSPKEIFDLVNETTNGIYKNKGLKAVNKNNYVAFASMAEAGK